MSALKRPLETISIQDRDSELFKGLFECRVMTAEQIAHIHFEGRKEAAKKRLQKLKAAGYIGERARRSFEQAVLYLTQKSLVLLRDTGVLAEYPSIGLPSLERRVQVSALTLRHELEVIDVKAAIHSAVRNSPTLSVPEFGTWPRLYEFEAVCSPYHGARILVRPDGFVRIHEKEPDGGLSEYCFFLELDRSTESQDTLISRAVGYLDYYKSGGFAERNGAARTEFKDYPFRVLMVFKTVERRNNTAERLLHNTPPIFTQVCLSTIEEVRNNPLGPIWIRPIDYRDATAGTAYDSEKPRPQFGYQRQTARESFVEANVRKLSLLAV